MMTMKNWVNVLMQKLKSLITAIGGITKLPPYIKLLIAAIFVLIMIPLALQYRHHQLYTVSAADRQLLTKASIDTSKIKVTAKTVSYNMADQKPTGDKNVTIAGPTDATGKTGYQATINKDFKQGLTFGDSASELSFKMTPLFGASKAQYQNGQVMFPVSGSTRIFQTFKKNGVKEDIILTKAPAKTASWQWQLGLGDKLSAKLLPNGSVGIFSSSPFLFGNLTVSDAKSQKLVDAARKTDRTNLAFVIPAPYIKDAKGFKNYEDVSFKLSGNTLTLEARNLTNKTYPLSLDPSVVVTTNADFLTGSDDGSISYPGAGNISRSNISAGTVGGWSTTTGFATARYLHTSVAYNGYLYVLGGYDGSGYLNDVQKATINADGTVGAWSATTPFTTARYLHTSVAYNGYLYVLGGYDGTSYLNDVQKAAIDPTNGTVGTWSTTTAFTTGRYGHTSAAYNGYLYVIGGFGSGYLNDVQKAAINADGTVGTWATTTAFTTGRYGHTSVAYNGYLYVIGGSNGSDQNDIQFSLVVAATGGAGAGGVGTWNTTTAFTTARQSHTSVAYNGYLYVIGGQGGSSNLNDVQKAAINADGTVGTWSTTTAFTTARYGHTSVAYNGYLYVIGGYSGSYQNDVQYASFNGPAQTGHYDRTVDIGRVVDSMDSVVINGTSPCGYTVQYALAGSSGTYGAITTLTTSAIPGNTNTLSGATLVRYIKILVTLNDQTCGGTSSISDVTVNYTLLPPAAPTLSAPASGAITVSTTPQFQFKTTDTSDVYARYKILVYQSDCSTLVRTIDQTSSQTGWSGQDAQTSTAYVMGTSLAASTLASHTYQAAGLSLNATYCWKAAAIDPGGSNTFGSYSATQLFSTNFTPTVPTLVQPSSSQTGVSTLPEFRLYSTDQDSDYIKYKIDVCSTSNCSSIVRTIDETSSQTGWSSQSQQSATAYSSGQTAIHTYQAAAMSANTQYWWRAYAIDPAGNNVFSAASGIGTFTTALVTQTNVNIGGGTTIYGGTSIGQ